MPQRTRSKRDQGRSRAPAELARCRTSGSMPTASTTCRAVHEGLLLRVVGGVVGLVAAGEVRPDAGDPDRAGLLGVGRGRLDQRRPVRAVAPAAAEPGVDLELHPRRDADRAGGRGDLVELGDGVGGHVDVGLDRRARSPPRGPSARSGSGRCRPAARSASASSITAAPEPVGAAGPGCRGPTRRARGRSRRP